MMAVRLHILLVLVLLLFSVSSSGVDAFGRRPQPLASIEPDEDSDEPEIVPTTPEGIAERGEQLTLAGQVMPVLKRFIIGKKKLNNIIKALQDALNEQEFFIIALVGWAWFPLNKFLHDIFEQRRVAKRTPTIGDHKDDNGTAEEEEGDLSSSAGLEVRKFDESNYWYQSARHIAQAARIGTFVYGCDAVAVILNTIGFRYRQQQGYSAKAAHISFSVWVALRVGDLKHWMLRKFFNREKNQSGKVQVYNHIANFILAAFTFGHVLDLFDVNIGVALASLLSIGGVGTLVLSLASKDIATELVSGLAVGASDRFLPGDEIVLGDGTAGFIDTMGLLYTDVRGYNEVITRIPNSQLSGQRATNLSRAAPKSQVKQTLRFSYKDVKKMPELMQAMKEEIKKSCPTLIVDGSRPFRAHWRDFSESWLEVVVDAHFDTRPTGDVYYDLRQDVLVAIARAAEKLGVQFTLPASICTSERLS
mmetsp:Transcript_2922/g.4947  ORF Transcript_2922/g.4947 Transcript_2922/m.4947 type:complete len:476 (-) Transcript_2922:113-1540(-)